MPVKGRIEWVSGPAIKASGMEAAKMNETVDVGEDKLIGEVIRLQGDLAWIQVYESTAGVKPGEPVVGTGLPLSVSLGPGMIGKIYDGLQRPLEEIAKKSGSFIRRGVTADSISLQQKWNFEPKVKAGYEIEGGTIIGTVQETPLIEHRILAKPDLRKSTVNDIAPPGKYEVEQVVATATDKNGKKEELKLYHRWPVRMPRPYATRYDPVIPLQTGQRVLDTFFPVAKGGTAAIPGGFGTGKCIPAGTPVLLSDGQLIPIEELYSRFAGEGQPQQAADEVFVCAGGVSVFSFDGTNLVKQEISHVYRGRTDRLLRIRTASGRTTTVTPAHKLIWFGPDARFEERASAQLSVGDFIALPRRIPIGVATQPINAYSIEARVVEHKVIESMRDTLRQLVGKCGSVKALARALGFSEVVVRSYLNEHTRPTTTFVAKLYSWAGLERPEISELKSETGGTVAKIPKVFDEDFGEFLGFLLSDGMIAGREIRFFNNDGLILERFQHLAERLFGIKAVPKRFKTVDGVCIHNTVVIRLLHSLGFPHGRKSRNAAVPSVVMMSPDSVVGAFVRGYFLGDGSFSEGTLEISSESNKLVDGMSYLLSRLGVLYSIMGGRRAGKRLIISSIKELRNFISSTRTAEGTIKSVRKVSSLIEFASKEWSSQTRDLVPIDANLLRSAFKSKAVENYVGGGERLGITKFQELLQSRSSEDVLGKRLHDLAGALEWVFVDQISCIEVLQGEQVVYDVTVPDYHNFVGGPQPMILHNTVTLHSVAKWADSKVVFHVGCGERGNEMTEVLVEFPELTDPQSGRPLMERTILIANVSNMPVAAREASIYTGVTMAEYYRDQGYDVVLVADSTSRWAEALREISGRLEEMPAEEGYPSYLASRLAEFYERAGRVKTLGTPERDGSVTLIGAVSPTGADFTEPVTSNTIRFIKTFWALETGLAYSRHYPAINWITSYSGYVDSVSKWWIENVTKDWVQLRSQAYAILQREDTLKEIVRLLGPESLPDEEKLILDVARMIQLGFLQQNAYDDVDAYCSPEKQVKMLKMFVTYYDEALKALRVGVQLSRIRGMQVIAKMLRMKFAIKSTEIDKLDALQAEMLAEFASFTKAQEVQVVV